MLTAVCVSVQLGARRRPFWCPCLHDLTSPHKHLAEFSVTRTHTLSVFKLLISHTRHQADLVNPERKRQHVKLAAASGHWVYLFRTRPRPAASGALESACLIDETSDNKLTVS